MLVVDVQIFFVNLISILNKKIKTIVSSGRENV